MYPGGALARLGLVVSGLRRGECRCGRGGLFLSRKPHPSRQLTLAQKTAAGVEETNELAVCFHRLETVFSSHLVECRAMAFLHLAPSLFIKDLDASSSEFEHHLGSGADAAAVQERLV